MYLHDKYESSNRLAVRLFIQENPNSKESKALEWLASKYKDLSVEGFKKRLKVTSEI